MQEFKYAKYMKNLAKDQDCFLEDGIYLPSFLFLAKNQAAAVSPASSFNPAGALENDAFQSSISPSQSLKKKKIIIDKDSFGFLLEEGERIAFLKRLQVAGFTIFFRGAENQNGVADFYKLEADLSNVAQLKEISQFNPKTDPEQIKKLQIASDEMLVLDAKDFSSKAQEIERAFCQNRYTDRNDWNIAFSKDLVPPLPSFRDPKYLQKMAFILDHSLAIREKIIQKLDEYFSSPIMEFDMEGFLTLLLSNRADVKNQLNDSVERNFGKNLQDFVFQNIYSNKEFFAAIEIFPNRHLPLEEYLQNLSKFNVIFNYKKLPELIEKFPDKKERLISRVEHESKASSDFNSYQISSILAAILRGKESEAIQKFKEFDEHLDNSEDEENPVFLKCQITAIFTRAAHNSKLKSGESDFFEEQLLQNIRIAINPYNPQISFYHLDAILPNLNSANIAKIAELIFETNQNFLSEKLVIAAARANPQIAEQLVKTYCSKNDSDTDSKKRVICSLPSRMVQNFLHGKIINSSDQFLLLEDLVGLKPSTTSDSYQNPKHTTFLQFYDASEHSKKCNWWLSRFFTKDLSGAGNADNVVAVKIANRDGEIDVKELNNFINRALTKKIKHFSFSASLAGDDKFAQFLKTINENGVDYQVFDYENYWGIGNSIRESELKKRSEIRIAFNVLKNQIDVDNSLEKPTYKMALAGEVLNESSEGLQIRTALIENDIINNLGQKEYRSQNLTQVSSVDFLDNQAIEDLRDEPSQEHIFCKFSQSLKANVRSRLLSVDASEDFYGIVQGQLAANEIAIFKGDDDFFYAQSSKDCDLDYVIKAPNPDITDKKYFDLSQNDPIRKIIDEYRDLEKGFSPIASADKEDVKYESEDHAESMARMFDERLGSCRHRAAAVLYKIRSSLAPNEQERCRMVRINNNHVILEIKSADRNNWFQVDLGGASAQLTELPNNIKYRDGIDATDIEAASKQNIGESSRQQNIGKLPAKSSAPQELEKAAQESSAQQMFNNLYWLTQFPKVTTEQGLIEKIDGKSKSLIVSSNVADNANFLLQQARNSGREVFYIDDPKKARLHKMNLQIAGNQTPFIAKESPLFDFLQRAESANDEVIYLDVDESFDSLQRFQSANQPLLLINWDVFDAAQKVAMNTILDQKRMIADVEIDNSIQVVGFSCDYPKDASFIYRHDAAVVSEISPENNKKEQQDPQIIDLEGFSDWRRKLFGSIILAGEEMIWQKSDFVLSLEKGEKNFKIINLSPNHEQELQYEVKQAAASGKLTYHGYEIAIAPDLEVSSLGNNAFSFDRLNDESQISVQEYNKIPQGAVLINKHLFDLLLCDHEIANGFYHEKEGLIKKAADGEEKLLKLFISSELSDGQWYCLFSEAQKSGLKLELYLNWGVKIPHQVRASEIDGDQPFETQKITAHVFVSKDTESALEKVKESLSDIYAVIDVEDFSYQDLVERVDFETTKSGFIDFQKTKSQVVEKLKEGKKIILKGKFSEGLLNSLSPLLIEDFAESKESADFDLSIFEDYSDFTASANSGIKFTKSDLSEKEADFSRSISDKPDFGRNLILIVEEDENTKNLSWLSPEEIYGLNADQNNFSEVDFEKIESNSSLENSKEEAQKFIIQRKLNLWESLHKNKMLRLVGHSGVGKSSLLREFENDDSESVKVYRELNNFEEWARGDGATDKMKILFIDESNMEDLHLTMFSPLKRGDSQRIFYKQKFYELDENHKVIFACNPAQYGGGRFEQKLFDDGKISAVELRDFPPSYIYERILKKTIYDNLAPEIQAKIPEENFKDECATFIEQYQQANSGKDVAEGNAETVRELQEKVLRFVEIKTSGLPNLQIDDSDFVSTNATKEVEESLALSLRIRQKQSEGNFPHQACGLNAVLLNGDSGTGKSVLIKAVLKNEGLSEIKYESEASSQNARSYYKISANLPLQEKKKIITKAFEEGNVVWIDELNSCIDDGLEKILNAVLTGEHPEGKSGKPGFMLISSINSATELEGRSMISPALRHRTLWHDVRSLKNYEENDFNRIITCWTKDDANFISAAPEVARDFMACLHSRADTDFNLRMLKMTLPNLAEIYLKESSLNNPKRSEDNETRSPGSTVQLAKKYEEKGEGENFNKMVKRQKARIRARESGLKKSLASLNRNNSNFI